MSFSSEFRYSIHEISDGSAAFPFVSINYIYSIRFPANLIKIFYFISLKPSIKWMYLHMNLLINFFSVLKTLTAKSFYLSDNLPLCFKNDVFNYRVEDKTF